MVILNDNYWVYLLSLELYEITPINYTYMNYIVPTIAIADNHRLMRQTLAAFLTNEGYQVVIQAGNGRILLDQIKTESKLPDICLLDIEMPEMDGYETAACLRREYPSIKILGITVFDNSAKKERMLRCGADGFLIKTGNPAEWLQIIQQNCSFDETQTAVQTCSYC